VDRLAIDRPAQGNEMARRDRRRGRSSTTRHRR
jgi:hypothetical protein